MHIFRIAFRNMSRQRKRTFLLAGAIALGILVITLVNAAAGGFQRNITQNFSRLLGGQVFIQGVERTGTGRTVNAIREASVLTDVVRQSGIPASQITRSSTFLGTLIAPDATGAKVSTAVQQIVGIEWGKESEVEDRLVFTKGSASGMNDPQGIVISEKIASRLGVSVGQSLLAQLRTVTGQQNVGEFHVVALSRDSGLADLLAAYANLSYVNSLINLPADEYQTLGIMLKGSADPDAAAATLYSALGTRVSLLKRSATQSKEDPVEAMLRQHEQNPMAGMMASLVATDEETWSGMRYRVYTITDILAQAQLPQLVGAVRGIAFLLLLVLFLIIIVGITNTFRLVVEERTREIGTMRALGIPRRTVRGLILAEALLIFLGGTLAGLAIAGLIMGVLQSITVGTGPEMMMLKAGRPSFVLDAGQTIAELAVVGLLTMLAALFPAHKASRLSPAAALAAIR